MSEAANELRRAAAELIDQSHALAQALDDVVRWTGVETWTGPASNRFRVELGERRAQVAAVADDMLRAAGILARRADTAEAPPATPAPSRPPARP